MACAVFQPVSRDGPTRAFRNEFEGTLPPGVGESGAGPSEPAGPDETAGKRVRRDERRETFEEVLGDPKTRCRIPRGARPFSDAMCSAVVSANACLPSTAAPAATSAAAADAAPAAAAAWSGVMPCAPVAATSAAPSSSAAPRSASTHAAQSATAAAWTAVVPSGPAASARAPPARSARTAAASLAAAARASGHSRARSAAAAPTPNSSSSRAESQFPLPAARRWYSPHADAGHSPLATAACARASRITASPADAPRSPSAAAHETSSALAGPSRITTARPVDPTAVAVVKPPPAASSRLRRRTFRPDATPTHKTRTTRQKTIRRQTCQKTIRRPDAFRRDERVAQLTWRATSAT